MGLSELESAIERLPADQLASFAAWFEEFLAETWDRQVEADILGGRLENAGRQAEIAAVREGLVDLKAGRIRPAQDVFRDLAEQFALPLIDE